MKKLLFCLTILCLSLGCSEMAPDAANYEYAENANQGRTTGNSQSINANGFSNSKITVQDDLIEVNRFKNLKIIKTGGITIEVDDFKKTRDQLDSLITLHNGFISKENAEKPNDRMKTVVTIKLLPDQFYPFLKSIEPLASKVHAKNIHTSDATQEYTDLEARLKAREDIAERYKVILKRANTIGEIFTVEEKLRGVLEDIEAMKGRIRYLNEQVGLSTVTVTIFQYLPVADIAEAGFFTKLGHAFTFGWNDILSVVLKYTASWHLLLFWGSIAFFAYRWLRSRNIFRQLVRR